MRLLGRSFGRRVRDENIDNNRADPDVTRYGSVARDPDLNRGVIYLQGQETTSGR